ncbi:Chromosome partitioning protein parB (plasmid) [Roseomonas mucosa]|uniref:ParB/RepB/Spo0J family partition protein n=1 Tax=Roseomonas mucosa TaxID=207340 RepID=UPI002245BEAB|nr:ParB/RepB/Spo0J family partition protein [Roseomonas mucosa]UZO95006.1 Chromosome partitioning protein parB [Roseomonas mucosa]
MSKDNKQTPAPKPAPARPKAMLGGAALGGLMAAAGGDTRGEPIRIPLADIDEDPNQPRRHFDQGELESLAESIRLKDVIQPITVRPAVKGRYMLVAGARRFRGSKLAGKKDIPAVIRAPQDGDFAAQVIENTQRSDLTNSELVKAVAQLAAEGSTNKQIAAICNLKDYQVSQYRKFADYPAELQAWVDRADMRALYDLHRVWEKGGEQIAEALAAFEAANKDNPGATLTITEARRIASGITGKPTGSIVLDRAPAPAPAPAQEQAPPPAPASAQLEASSSDGDRPAEAPPAPTPKAQAPAPILPESTNQAPAPEQGERLHGANPSPAPAPQESAQAPRQSAAPVFVVRVGGGAEGRLVVDRRAEKEGRALVELDGSIEEVDPAEISLVRIE